jgi:uncharacterized protein
MNLKKLNKCLPDVECQKDCNVCCSPVYMLPSEAKAMGLPEGRLYTNWNDKYECEFMTDEGCSQYENRPFICRFFGSSDHGMFSCNRVKGELITEEQAMKYLQLYTQIISDSNNSANMKVIEAMHYHDSIMTMQGINLERLRPGEKPKKYVMEIKTKLGN